MTVHIEQDWIDSQLNTIAKTEMVPPSTKTALATAILRRAMAYTPAELIAWLRSDDDATENGWAGE